MTLQPTTTHIPTQFSDAAFRHDPYPVYRLLRQEAPVAYMKAPFGSQAYLITRYEDVVSALNLLGPQ